MNKTEFIYQSIAMSKLYDDPDQMVYSADHVSNSWKEFITKKPFEGNHTYPIRIIDYSWVQDENDDDEAQTNDSGDRLYLVCKDWAIAGDGYDTFTFEIHVTKEDELEISKFINEHQKKSPKKKSSKSKKTLKET